ncbi:MAG: bleomycin resistance protein [Chitinophagaceae bacterium]|nr:bleomycin resistance protein [Chitinophagaceae bacterium]
MKKLKNAISWFEIPITDVPRAKKFYETILDIEMMEIELDTDFIIVIFPVEDGTVAGALCKHEGFYTPGQTGNILYLNAGPDLQQVLDKVESAGGKIVKGKNHISDAFGFTAYIEDSEGNRIGLHSLT